MNNQDRFREWYIAQINPRTGMPYSESSATTYVAAIRRAVTAGIVRHDIFDVDADEFSRQTRLAQERHPAEFAALDNHGNLKHGIKWWKQFLDSRE